MYKVDTKTYGELLKRCYNAKSPLYVYGGPGVGKSEIPRQVFTEYAKLMKREFLEWTSLSLEQKKATIESPEKYWIFCDQRVGQMDSTDLRGIPNMVNTDMLECVPMSWVIYFTKPKAAGAIFFDELNLAAPVVAGQAYQIINDRAISDRKLADDVFVFGAGNRSIDQAHTFEMPFPLRDRFNEFEIYPTTKAWTEWASGKVNPHLVAFINWKESYLYKPAKDANNKGSTPRGIVRASHLINDESITSDTVHMYISIAVGEAFATEFQAYCKYYQELNWKKILEDPAIVAKFSVDKLWAVIGGLAEMFQKMSFSGSELKDHKAQFESMINVFNECPADFAVVGLRMLRDANHDKFIKQVKGLKSLNTIIERYGKFIVNVD